MDQTPKFCSNCGSEEIRLILVDRNCLYNYLGNFICKKCCQMCDWDGNCFLNLSWKADFIHQSAVG